MTTATAVFKKVAYKKNAGAYGAAPGASDATYLSRVQSTLSMSKDAYKSARVNPNHQVTDSRHGVRRVTGQLQDELAPGALKEFFAAALRKDFAAVSAITGASITISGTGPYTIARTAGSYLTDGIKVGMVVRLTAGSFNAANLNKNLVVTAVTALNLTVIVLNGSTLTAEGPIASATVSVPGKVTYTPETGHTDDDFGIEHWHSDNNQSELFTGVKPTKISVSMSNTGIITVSVDLIGQDQTNDTSQYFSSPAAAATAEVLSAVNGVLLAGGSAVTNITGLSLEINSGYTGDAVVGSNTVPELYADTITVSGQLTARFDSTTLRDAFINETEMAIIGIFTSDNTAAADFLNFNMPRVKLMSHSKADGPGAIVQTFNFDALFDSTGGSGQDTEATTLLIQDSAA